MKKILFLLFCSVVVTAFIAREEVAQTMRTIPVNPPSAVRVQSVNPPRIPTLPSVQIKPELPLTQPIRIEIGKDIAKSVEIKKVAGKEINIVTPAATVIRTSPTEPNASPSSSP